MKSTPSRRKVQDTKNAKVFLSQHLQQITPAVDKSLVGSKAVGLYGLPTNWTPPFFVLSSTTRSWRVRDINDPLNLLQIARFESVIARSSASLETLKDRGLYKSEVCAATPTAVIAAASKISEHGELIGQLQSLTDSARIAVIIQGYAEPHARGHLSNERRVSRCSTDWLLEMEIVPTGEQKSTRIHVGKRRSPPYGDPIGCSSLTDIARAIESVAANAVASKQRVHFEWIWDGRRIWIVQRDVEPDVGRRPKPGAPPPTWHASKLPRTFRILRLTRDDGRKWSKTECIRCFRKCGIPFGDIFRLEGKRILDGLRNGKAKPDLRREIESLMEVPIVIRTDVEHSGDSSGLLLPRTDAVRTVAEALDFMQKTLEQLSSSQVTNDRICFLLHRLIPAESGAWAFARPSISHVRIDSLWGSPDGLNYYAHDSFYVDTRDRRIAARRVRCKTEYVDLDENGKWVERPTGSPWDWRASASDEDLFTVAGYASRLAEFLNRPVALMCFVGVDARTGLARCLPWYYPPDTVSDVVQEGTAYRFIGKRTVITSNSDLKRFTERLSVPQNFADRTICLRPRPELLRSTEFLDDISEVCKRLHGAVELEGSILSHAYYVLRRNGVRVRCIDPFQESLGKQRFGKLVRDKIPLRISSHGEEAQIYHVSTHELVSLLKAKALEEALELFWEANREQTLEEVVDVLEVVESLGRTLGMSPSQLRSAARKKRRERGGFEKGVVLIETRAVPLLAKKSRGGELFAEPSDGNAPIIRSGMPASRTPKLQGSDVLLPLVPPDIQARSRTYSITIPGAQLEVSISYEAATIRFSVRQANRVSGRDPRQRVFDFYLEGK